jgi:hypothetical protein
MVFFLRDSLNIFTRTVLRVEMDCKGYSKTVSCFLDSELIALDPAFKTFPVPVVIVPTKIPTVLFYVSGGDCLFTLHRYYFIRKHSSSSLTWIRHIRIHQMVLFLS